MESSKRRQGKQIALMMLMTIGIQVFGLFRVIIVARKFGVSPALDAFNFASSIAVVIFSFIGVGVTTVLMPNIGKESNKKAINTFIVTIYSGATIILALTIIFSKVIVGNFMDDKGASNIETAAILLVVLVIAQYIASYMGVSNAILNFQEKFNIPKIGLLVMSIAIVILLYFEANNSIVYYADIVLVTAVINFIFQQFFMRRSGFKLSLSFDFKDKVVRGMFKSFLPVVVSTGLYQISILVDTFIASRLGTGKVSILNYSNYLIGMVSVIFIANISSFLYPKIVKSLKHHNIQERIMNYIIIVSASMSFIVINLIISGREIIGILYTGSGFTVGVSRMIYLCMCIYAVAIPTNAARDIIYKYFYATGDTSTPFKNSLFISVLNIIMSVIFARFIGLYGVVLGTSITTVISAIIIFFKFKKKFGVNFNEKVFLIENFKIICVTLITFGLSIFLRQYYILESKILEIIVNTVIITIIYIGMLILLRSKLLKEMKNYI
ncbi:murein biosynthesis integral membrane protein MurJ [uncultured Clostridium sp.]|uniref:murein biosynthesis integral membrane protein MurJ n=1 Tax=uncultured Clostridium sp. TaxID=59620 RepID=UPI0026091BAA|nr:lipid II flippase MurJ [uncultured Clostridium sp.]